jgi:hypothetical protein
MSDQQPIDITGFQLHPHIVGGDEEDTALIAKEAQRAMRFVQGFRWAPPIERLYLAWGVPGILCLFLVKFGRPIAGNPDDELWVVVGDLPTAYFVTEGNPDPHAALEAYCWLMENWADAVLAGEDLSQQYPVGVEPTEEHAKMLKSRLGFIDEKFLPQSHRWIGGVDREAGMHPEEEDQ